MNMDCKTFGTKEAAEKCIATHSGWNERPSKLFLPNDKNADAQGCAWVIRCDKNKFLRTDDYVR